MGIELIVDNTRIEFRKELILPSLTEPIKKGKFYKFNMEGYNIFHLGKTISLLVGGSSNPIASVQITEQTNYLLGGQYHTKGEFCVRVC